MFQVKKILWNQDSSILALHIDDYSGISELDVSHGKFYSFFSF